MWIRWKNQILNTEDLKDLHVAALPDTNEHARKGFEFAVIGLERSVAPHLRHEKYIFVSQKESECDTVLNKIFDALEKKQETLKLT
jgi:hypothetical protein